MPHASLAQSWLSLSALGWGLDTCSQVVCGVNWASVVCRQCFCGLHTHSANQHFGAVLCLWDTWMPAKVSASSEGNLIGTKVRDADHLPLGGCGSLLRHGEVGGLERHIYQGVGWYWVIQGTEPFPSGQVLHRHHLGPQE